MAVDRSRALPRIAVVMLAWPDRGGSMHTWHTTHGPQRTVRQALVTQRPCRARTVGQHPWSPPTREVFEARLRDALGDIEDLDYRISHPGCAKVATGGGSVVGLLRA